MLRRRRAGAERKTCATTRPGRSPAAGARTPDSAGNIWNLQGRYWTPALPLLLCAAFARDPDPTAPEPAPTGLLFPALALLHLDAVVCIVKTTLGG